MGVENTKSTSLRLSYKLKSTHTFHLKNFSDLKSLEINVCVVFVM